jgi:hypothetical protein
MEVLRRAVAAAHHAADVATTAAWRADARMAEVVEAVEAAKALRRTSAHEQLLAFLDAETQRIRDLSTAMESAGYLVREPLYHLVEFMGAEKKP